MSADRLNDASQNDANDPDLKIRADAQDGLYLIPETEEGDAYALGSNPDAPYVEPPRPAKPAPETVESADVYGLAEPTPTPTGSVAPSRPTPRDSDSNEPKTPKTPKTPNAPGESPNKPTSKPRSRAESDSFDAPATSLEEIYERKRRERAESGDDLYQPAKRPELPARPYWDRIFRPFESPKFLVNLALTSAAAFIPLFFATLFFSRVFSHAAAEMIREHQDLNALIAFFRCVWQDKVVFLLFAFLWGIFSAPRAAHIFVETANGADEIDEWPEYNFVGGLGQFLWLATLIALGGIPGAALFRFLGFDAALGFVLSSTILTPIFFLSCMQADALFVLFTKDVLRSVKRVSKAWLDFYFIDFAFLFGTLGLALASLGFVVSVDIAADVEHAATARAATEAANVGVARLALAAAFVSVLFSFVPSLYLRFLGRLAWVIDDDCRKRQEAEEEAEEAQYADEEDEK